jgi:hypothetical protein
MKLFNVLKFIPALATCLLFSCTSEVITLNSDSNVASCEGCHTNYAHLQKVYSPDTTGPAGGCGGEAPHFEPFDRVFIGGDGYQAFKKTAHYDLGCTYCHNGNNSTSDKETAHSGNFIKHPSSVNEEKCGACHNLIVNNFKTSIHQGMGQKRKVAIRSGLGGHEDFDKLPAHQIEGYNKNCATCHASCGSCHVVRPVIGGGGLISGHNFNRTPDMVNVCVSCHTSRGGHAFLGVAPGTKPDVHFTKAGYKCTDCHNMLEMHGDGKAVAQRYEYGRLPECKDCHTYLDFTNNYHKAHYDDFNCQMCHSQKYNNCGSCHVGGEGARVASYMDFKIGANPIPNLKKGYKFTTVRRTLAAPDNWKSYGVANYPNFNALPTYNYTSPHNIQKWTDRTLVDAGKQCFTKCHIVKEGNTVLNKELYLFNSNLLDWEKQASASVTVDGKLPPSWILN